MKRRRFIEFLAAGLGFVVPALIALAPAPSSTAAGPAFPPFVQSPPVYAARGTSVAITAIAAGRPERVTLVAGGAKWRMDASKQASAWTGTIRPRDAHTIRYSVVASYAGQQVTSEPYDLIYLDRIATKKPSLSSFPSAQLASVPLGDGPDALGTSDGAQAARILPAAFAVDAGAGEIDVLDTPKARVVTYGFGGYRLRTHAIETGSTTVSDLVRATDGSEYLLDTTRDQLLHRHGSTTDVFDGLGVRDDGVNERLSAHGPDVSVRDPRQGLDEPLFDASSRRVEDPSARRATVSADGVNVVAAGSSIVIGASTKGLRVAFDDPVIDVLDTAKGTDGTVWTLVDVASEGTARTILVAAHLDTMRVRAAAVDAAIFGDVTRRLVALDDSSAVVMSGTSNALTFTRYSEVHHVAA